LNEDDFKSAEAVASGIDKELGTSAARVVDSRTVQIRVSPGQDVPELLARVEAIEVPFYPHAKVVVNERTGTVVIGGSVVLQPVSILHGGLAVNIVSQFEVSQPGPFSSTGTTQVVQQTRVEAKDRVEAGSDGGRPGAQSADDWGLGAGCDLDPAGDEGSGRAGGGA
jgi:flagellar P-ring protein precursor FlgI